MSAALDGLTSDDDDGSPNGPPKPVMGGWGRTVGHHRAAALKAARDAWLMGQIDDDIVGLGSAHAQEEAARQLARLGDLSHAEEGSPLRGTPAADATDIGHAGALLARRDADALTLGGKRKEPAAAGDHGACEGTSGKVARLAADRTQSDDLRSKWNLRDALHIDDTASHPIFGQFPLETFANNKPKTDEWAEAIWAVLKQHAEALVEGSDAAASPYKPIVLHEHRAPAAPHPFTYVYERISQPRSWFALQRAEHKDPAAVPTVKLNANGGGEVWRVTEKHPDGSSQGLLASSMLMVRQPIGGGGGGGSGGGGSSGGGSSGGAALGPELIRGKQFQRVVIRNDITNRKVRLKSGDLQYIDESKPISLVHMMVLTARKEPQHRTPAPSAQQGQAQQQQQQGGGRGGAAAAAVASTASDGVTVIAKLAAGVRPGSVEAMPMAPRIAMPVMVDNSTQTD